MISVLMVSAFMSWGSYVDEARKVSTLNRMDGIRKALETWNADHSRGYPTYDLEPLLGRYIPNTEGDGWGNDFLVDRYLMRIISRGRDGVLDTPIPGWEEGPLGGYGGDDLIQSAQENGRVVIVGSNGLYMIQPDGTHFLPLVDGASWGDVAPGGGAVIWADGSDLLRDWVDESDSFGAMDIASGSIEPSLPMTWFTDKFGSTGWGTLSIAPDGFHVAAFRLDGGQIQLISGELVDPSISASAPPYLVTTFSLTELEGSHRGRLAWDRRSTALWVNSRISGNTLPTRINSSPNSAPTTYGWTPTPVSNTFSIDTCATGSRFAFLHDNTAYLTSATGTPIATWSVPSGFGKLVALNRKCDAMVVVNNSDDLYIWWPKRPMSPDPGGEGNPFLLIDGATLTGEVGTVHEVRWR